MGRRSVWAAIHAGAALALWANVTIAASTSQGVARPVATLTKVGERSSDTGKSCGGAACGRTLPATGQITPGAAGDDGSLRAGVPLSYVDNGDGTITDRTTGLMWEKKVNLNRQKDAANLHDADNCYPWRGHCANGGAACGSSADCGPRGSCETADCQTAAPNGLTIFKWVAQLNAAKFAGYNDWRIPNAKELQSIVDYGVHSPAVAPAFNGAHCSACSDLADPACSCTQSDNYWTSTGFAQGPDDGAWEVYFGNGLVGFILKHNAFFVRAVRGGL